MTRWLPIDVRAFVITSDSKRSLSHLGSKREGVSPVELRFVNVPLRVPELKPPPVRLCFFGFVPELKCLMGESVSCFTVKETIQVKMDSMDAIMRSG